MIGFIGPESKFIEPVVKAVLQKGFNSMKTPLFDFEIKLEGRITFERLYALFVEAFESSSYGDELFSALLMVPLAQKYDAKWRKRIWSEHCTALRFVTCTESQLFGSIEAYLSPEETDISLLKSYSEALKQNFLRKDSVPWKIAEHHTSQFRAKNKK